MENQQDIIVLAIESSCDETSAAVVKNGRHVLSNIINSQIDIHKKFGGVVPEVASRRHIEVIDYVVDEAIKTAGITIQDIDAVATTYTPGLVGALLVGLSWAKAFAFATGIPLVGVNHIKGHIFANLIEHKNLVPPFICLVASGGHSHIVKVDDYNDFNVIARTRDDAAGEAFDKVARVMGLGYPGGAKVDRLARDGNENAVKFPRAKWDKPCLDFSFSGVKTAVINHLHKLEQKKETYNKADIAASFQKAVVDVLVENTIIAAKSSGINDVCLAGGVACNSKLRECFSRQCKENSLNFYFPSPVLCTDNAAMIGAIGYYEFMGGKRDDLSLNAVAALKDF